MDLFDYKNNNSMAPLSARMRPSKLEDFIGQKHLLKEGSLLNRAVKADRLGSCIFYGPPGTGKTSLANIIAKSTSAEYVELNAVSSGVAEAKEVILAAKDRLLMFRKKTYLILDECHRWRKDQSDCVLSAMEKGEIIFIGSTTENPYSNMTKAIVSRCRIFEFKSLNEFEIIEGMKRALNNKEKGLGNYNVSISDEALFHIAHSSNGDLRVALDSLELSVITTPPSSENNLIKISIQDAEEIMQKKVISIDADKFYDILSAFCKSLRGSDPDAALFYATLLINSGFDPLIVARRLVVHSSEDVGLADPMALNVSVNALLALEKIGLPEGLIPLNEAIIYVSTSPKSNSVVTAMHLANEAAINFNNINVPGYLINSNYSSEKIPGYKYPHDYAGNWVNQQYLPDNICDSRFYYPSQNGYEKGIIIKKQYKIKEKKDE